MNDETTDGPTIMGDEPKQKALSVTVTQMVSYLNNINEAAKCSFCVTGEYAVSEDPSGNSTAIVAIPVPHMQNVGIWVFPAMCINCGHAIFFNAAHVIKAVEGER